ncbi:unnamed protein product, partial [Mesorhabditis belari]|uniref:Uncharacterized protein n=1 Tax=Mesorhabditis belari TaxID=2138241 RepID=A0AAF3EMQ4_9BILA
MEIDILMHCDWDLCNDILTVDFLKEQRVKCFVTGLKAHCMAQACLMIYYKKTKSFVSGCFWQDSRYAQGRFEVGLYSFTDTTHFIICAIDYCNETPGKAVANLEEFDCRPQGFDVMALSNWSPDYAMGSDD